MLSRDDLTQTQENLRIEVQSLKAQLEKKEKLIESIGQILRDYFTEEGGTTAIAGPDPAKRFVGMSRSEAILQFLNNQGDKSFSPGEITRGLRAGGMTSNSPRFDTVIMNECLRLVRRGQLKKVSDYGNFLYRLKQPGDEEA